MLLLLLLFGFALSDSFRAPRRHGLNEFAGNFKEKFQQAIKHLKSHKVSTKREASLSSDPLENIENFLTTLNSCPTMLVPGAALTIIKDGSTLFQKAYGKSDVENDVDATEDSLWPIGSTTKAITAAVLGSLVDQNLLTWDTRVDEVFPNWWSTNKNVRSDLTLTDFLIMRSDLSPNNNLWYYNVSSVTGTPSDLVEFGNFERYWPFVHPVRYQFLYMNYGYAIAAAMGEKVSNDNYFHLVKSRIFTPLDLGDGAFTTTKEILESPELLQRYVHPYYIGDDGVRRAFPLIANRIIDGSVSPAGSLILSIKAINKYLKSWLNGLPEVVTPETFQTMTAMRGSVYPQQIDAPEFELLWHSYTFGWVIGTYRGEQFFWHNGGTIGHTSMFLSFPRKQISIGLVQNILEVDFISNFFFGMYVYDQLQGYEPFIPVEAICSIASSTILPSLPSGLTSSISKADADKIIGTYSNPLWGKVYVKKSGGSVTLTIGVGSGLLYSQVPGTLEFTFYGESWVEPSPTSVKFGRGKLEMGLRDDGGPVIFVKTN